MTYVFVPGREPRREEKSKSEEEIKKETQEYFEREAEHEKLEARLKEQDPKARELWERYAKLRNERWKLEEEIKNLPPVKKIPILSTLKESLRGYKDLFSNKKDERLPGIQGEYQEVCHNETQAKFDWDDYVSLFSFDQKEVPNQAFKAEEQVGGEDKEKKLEELREDILGDKSDPES